MQEVGSSNLPGPTILLAYNVLGCNAGLRSALHPDVLEWCAAQDRVFFSHDVRPITRYVYRRTARGPTVPGVVEVNRSPPMAKVIDHLLVIAEASFDGEWQGQGRRLPL